VGDDRLRGSRLRRLSAVRDIALESRIGRNSRLETVEDDHGRHAEACLILAAAEELGHQFVSNLMTGYMTVSQWFDMNAAAIRRIENFIDHRMQGWKEAGLVTAEYRLDPTAAWQPMTKLLTYGDIQRAAIEAALDSDLHLTRTRQLSRAEAWKRGEKELVTLAPHCVPAILGPDLSEEKTVLDKNGGSFEFTKAGEDPVMYRALVRRDDGTGERLAPGMTYRVWQLADAGKSYLFVQHPSGKFLGVCEEIPRIEHGNTAAFLRRAGEVAQVHADTLAPFYRRAVKRDRAETRRRQMNVAQIEAGAETQGIEDADMPDYASLKK
jgi:hypothetical protein